MSIPPAGSKHHHICLLCWLLSSSSSKVSTLMEEEVSIKQTTKVHEYFKGKSQETPLNLVYSPVNEERSCIMKCSEVLRQFQSNIDRYEIKCFSPQRNLKFPSQLSL
jgi:hypothetical protein